MAPLLPSLSTDTREAKIPTLPHWHGPLPKTVGGLAWIYSVFPVPEIPHTGIDATLSRSSYLLQWFLLHQPFKRCCQAGVGSIPAGPTDPSPSVLWWLALERLHHTFAELMSTAVDWRLVSLTDAYVETYPTVWWYLEVGALGGDYAMKTEPSCMRLVPLWKGPLRAPSILPPREDTAKRWLSMNQEMCPKKLSNLLAPWSWTS